jgi:signal transduction histidine kinase
MSSSDPESEWPRLLRHAAHELRTPLGVSLGYLRMLVTSADVPLTDRQRQFVLESQKALGRLKTIADEMSDLAKLEAGEIKFLRERLEVGPLLAETVAALPPMEDRTISIELQTSPHGTVVQGDALRLKGAIGSIVFGLRRELVASTTLIIRESPADYRGKPASWIAIGDAAHIDALAAATPAMLTEFEQWRGGCGLNLAIAHAVLAAHGGAVWSPRDGTRAAALMVLPG